jgi:hypothetical protein
VRLDQPTENNRDVMVNAKSAQYDPSLAADVVATMEGRPRYAACVAWRKRPRHWSRPAQQHDAHEVPLAHGRSAPQPGTLGSVQQGTGRSRKYPSTDQGVPVRGWMAMVARVVLEHKRGLSLSPEGSLVITRRVSRYHPKGLSLSPEGSLVITRRVSRYHPKGLSLSPERSLLTLIVITPYHHGDHLRSS